MTPTSKHQSKPKVLRDLRTLGNDNYKNVRNGTNNLVPVLQDTGRQTRKCWAASSPAEDETVICILGRESNTAQISTDTPEKEKEIKKTKREKKGAQRESQRQRTERETTKEAVHAGIKDRDKE